MHWVESPQTFMKTDTDERISRLNRVRTQGYFHVPALHIALPSLTITRPALKNVPSNKALEADGAVACFSGNLFLRNLNADRAPQLIAVVRRPGVWSGVVGLSGMRSLK